MVSIFKPTMSTGNNIPGVNELTSCLYMYEMVYIFQLSLPHHMLVIFPADKTSPP